MTARIRSTSRPLAKIRSTSKTLPTVDPAEVAAALGAIPTGEERVEHGSAPLSLFAVREALLTRLHSSGGRPGLVGATRRQKIPLTDAEWEKLEQLADRLKESGVRITAGQVASALLHQALEHIDEDKSLNALQGIAAQA